MKTLYAEEPTVPYLQKIISKHPFWSGMNPHFFHAVYQCANFMQVPADQFIFREGQDADHFYLIHKGKIRIETFVPGKGNIVIQTLGFGDALGWSWLFPPSRWKFSVSTFEASELIAFGAAGLREYAEENRDFSDELLRRVSKILYRRLQATRERLVEFCGPLD